MVFICLVLKGLGKFYVFIGTEEGIYISSVVAPVRVPVIMNFFQHIKHQRIIPISL